MLLGALHSAGAMRADLLRSGVPLAPQLLLLSRTSLPWATMPYEMPEANNNTLPAPFWVSAINRSLESSALATLLAFLCVDIFVTCCVLSALIALRISVRADFALALALSKSLRAVRLALDASLAALLTRWCPSLKHVKISLCIDELTASWGMLRDSFEDGYSESRGVASAMTRSPSVVQERMGRFETAGLAARRAVEKYGLAYMAAKNAVALGSMLLLLAALRSGGAARSATAWLLGALHVSPNAGLLAGQVALAVTIHYALFPFVVLAAAKLGPWVERVQRQTT